MMKRVQNPFPVGSQAPPGLEKGAWIGQFELGGATRNLVYVLRDPESGEALLLDTQHEMRGVWEAVEAQGGRVVGVALTHTHWDHVPGLPEIAARFPGLPLYVHPLELHRIENEAAVRALSLREIADGDVIAAGSLRLEVLHTPGHSAGGCVFFARSPHPACFTGDTLFLGDCGRTDLPTGNDTEMFASLQRLKGLPPETWILPGHHYRPEASGTLSSELLRNPALRCGSLEELRALP